MVVESLTSVLLRASDICLSHGCSNIFTNFSTARKVRGSKKKTREAENCQAIENKEVGKESGKEKW